MASSASRSGQALSVWSTVISVSPGRWAIVDAGLKAFGMDHGNPTAVGWDVFFCSDEHTTLLPDADGMLPTIGSKVEMIPAHVDPTVAYHETLVVADAGLVVDRWSVDLRGW